MMESQDTPHPDYVTGFNQGYTIARDMPALAEQLSQAFGDTERGQGFQSGREQWSFEAKEQRRPVWLRSDRLANLNKDNAQSKDKEPDRDFGKDDR